MPEPAPAAPSQGQDEVEVSPPQSCPLGLQEPELGRTAAPARPVQRRGGGTDQSDVYPPGGGAGGALPCSGTFSGRSWPLWREAGWYWSARPSLESRPSPLTAGFLYQP